MSAPQTPARPIPWNGEQIKQPGIYAGVPIETYHGDPDLLPGPRLSPSAMRTITADSPGAYWIRSIYNPLRVKEEPSRALAVGSAAHCLLLGESEFWQRFAVRPERFDSWRTKEAKEWRQAAWDEGLIVLEPSDIETIRGMAGLLPWQKGMPESGLRNSRYVELGLMEGDAELTIVDRDDETGVWRTVRPDLLSRSSGIIVELKTTVEADPGRAIWNFGYHQSAAAMAEVVPRATGWPGATVVFVFIQKVPPYRVSIHELTEDADPVSGKPIDPYDIGRRQNRKALRTFSKCMETGVWPAGDGEARAERMPGWLASKIERELEIEEASA